MHVAAIVLAAGAGRRIGGDVAKTYLPIAGRPLVYALTDVRGNRGAGSLIVAASERTVAVGAAPTLLQSSVSGQTRRD
jgi:CTP:molybdopterin cytidylyltransferase MocA